MFWSKIKVVAVTLTIFTAVGIGVGAVVQQRLVANAATPVGEKPIEKPGLTDEQMAELALKAAKKGLFVELQEIHSKNTHLGGKRILEQPLAKHRFWCALHAYTPAAPKRSFLAVSRAGEVISPVDAKQVADILKAEDRSKWSDEQYLQATALYIHLTGTPSQDGWKVLESSDDFLAIKFNMFPQNEKKREEAAKPIKKPIVQREKDVVRVRLWAWHLIGGRLREWTAEYKADGFTAKFEEHGMFGGGGYD